MADSGAPQRDLVYCHSCENEWYRDEHGLECPECQSDVVEIITEDTDPREAHHLPHEDDEEDEEEHHPLHGHNPWSDNAPDPDEGDIDHVEWTGSGGAHFSRTTYRSSNTGTLNTQAGSTPQDFANLFGAFFGPNLGMRGNPQQQNAPGNMRSPLQEGPAQFPGTQFTFTTGNGRGGGGLGSARFTATATGGNRTLQMQDLAGIFGPLLQSLDVPPGGLGNGPRTAPNPMAFLSSLLNPANARHGDAVFTQEAMDRVISNLMEQHASSTAPGPASDVAIKALPKIKITEEHLDSQGKAECSICMDNLSIGDEVTELPCHHWFHGECVSAWLREHDTCPQCRRGITPKDGDADTPRATGQAPRFWQMQGNDPNPQAQAGNASSNPGSSMSGTGTQHDPYQISSSPPSSGSSRRRGNSTSGGTLGSITGWMGRHFGSGGGGDGANHS